MKETVLASGALANEQTFNLESAISLAKKELGVSLSGMTELTPGKLYSPTRPVSMKVASSGDRGGSVTIQPNQIIQFLRINTETEEPTAEFLGTDKIYAVNTNTVFAEMEPLFFVKPTEKELDSEFSIFDSFGSDKIQKLIMERFNMKEFIAEGTFKNKEESDAACLELIKKAYTETVREVLDPLIAKNVLVEYKLLDEEKMLVLQLKTTPKGTYCRLELGY